MQVIDERLVTEWLTGDGLDQAVGSELFTSAMDVGAKPIKQRLKVAVGEWH